MAKITKITLWHRDNHVVYDDSDIQTDYFHSYRLGVQETNAWLREYGADLVTVHLGNNQFRPAYEKRVLRMAREAGYEVERSDAERRSLMDEQVWTELRFLLSKVPKEMEERSGYGNE